MKTWSVHYLNARGALEPLKERIHEALSEVATRADRVAEPLVLDIVIQSVAKGGIPEIGHVGHAPRPGVLMLTFDPDNPNLLNNMGESLERMIAHELHHVMRWDTVGYGRTLGEALISEGLAGRFAQELYGNDGEIWETAIEHEDLTGYAKMAVREADKVDYDHSAWFFGRGDLPRWVGYSLGWEVVGHYLRNTPDARPSALAATPAEQFRPSLRAFAKA